MTSSYYAKKAVFGESMMKALLMSSLILISAAAVDVEKEEHLRLHQQPPANHRNTQTTDSSNNSSCIEVSIFLDEYPADTRWDIFDDPPPVNTTTAEPLATSPTYNESMALTQQTTQICTLDTPGNYSFIIYDDFFDGICCEWGNGSYAVMLVNTGEVLASGGQWSGPSESTRFVLDTLTVMFSLYLQVEQEEILFQTYHPSSVQTLLAFFYLYPFLLDTFAKSSSLY